MIGVRARSCQVILHLIDLNQSSIPWYNDLSTFNDLSDRSKTNFYDLIAPIQFNISNPL